MLGLRHVAAISSLTLSSSALAQNAVQWRVEDGGNGHWFQLVVRSEGMTWLEARSLAQNIGGDLACLGKVGAEQFVLQLLNGAMCGGPTGQAGPYVGAFQDQSSTDYSEPTGGWRWVDGTRFPGAPFISLDNAGGQDYLHAISLNGGCGGPFRLDDVGIQSENRSYIVEWSADCNSDGIVDFGQIRSGELADTNANYIPDCCESPAGCNSCAADVDSSGSVNGVDLAAVLNTWGSDGGKYPGADVNGDGIVDGADLAEVLNGWGSCP